MSARGLVRGREATRQPPRRGPLSRSPGTEATGYSGQVPWGGAHGCLALECADGRNSPTRSAGGGQAWVPVKVPPGGEAAMTTDVTGILRQTSLLRSVPGEDLQAVIATSRLRVFRRGQVVFITGDPGDTLVVVISGRVKVVVRSADGGELTLAIIEPGGVF